MAVAITCGYGGYLLPLLAAHSSCYCSRCVLYWIKPKHLRCIFCHPIRLFYPSALRAGGVLLPQSRRAAGCPTCGTHISVSTWRIFSIRSSVELSRPVVVHSDGHLPIYPIWACPWAKACQICHKLGPDFAEHISLKPLDGFTPFKVSWTCLDLQLCSDIVIYPFASYGLAHGPKTCQIRQHLGQTLRNPYLWNRWMDLYHLKLYVVQHHGYVTL